jgi:hypothetical protein
MTRCTSRRGRCAWVRRHAVHSIRCSDQMPSLVQLDGCLPPRPGPAARLGAGGGQRLLGGELHSAGGQALASAHDASAQVNERAGRSGASRGQGQPSAALAATAVTSR